MIGWPLQIIYCSIFDFCLSSFYSNILATGRLLIFIYYPSGQKKSTARKRMHEHGSVMFAHSSLLNLQKRTWIVCVRTFFCNFLILENFVFFKTCITNMGCLCLHFFVIFKFLKALIFKLAKTNMDLQCSPSLGTRRD